MTKKFLKFYRRLKINTTLVVIDHYVRFVIKKYQIKTIAVTGSLGKTSTRIAIAQVLQKRFKVFNDNENYNADRPLRLSFFGLKSPDFLRPFWQWLPIINKIRRLAYNYPYEVVVFEVAESRYPSLAGFVRSIQPTIGVVTGISSAHLAWFKSLEAITDHTWALAASCKTIIYNHDFDRLAAKANSTKNSLSYGLGSGAIHFREVSRSLNGYVQAKLVIDKQTIDIKTQLIAKHGLYALLAAATVAKQLGLTNDEIAAGLSDIKPVKGRMNLLSGANDARLIDDSFVADPIAMAEALKTLAEFDGRKIAVLGSMNDLGPTSEENHERIGRLAATVVDELVIVGRDASRYLGPAAQQAGLSPQRIKVCKTSIEAGQYVKNQLRPGDIVLIKGSQDKLFMEETTQKLLKNPGESTALLVRQNAYWLKKKQRFFKTAESELLKSDLFYNMREA